MNFIPIGAIHSPQLKAAGTPIQAALATGVQGTVEVFPEYAAGLRDLDGFERVWLVYWFDRAKPAELVVTPYRDTTPRGLFATRAPCRPNPIGLSCVRLLEVTETSSMSKGWTSWMGPRCWTPSRTCRHLMRSRRSESAGALRAGAAALWPMVGLKRVEASVWRHKLHIRMNAQLLRLVFLCGLVVVAGCKTESQQARALASRRGRITTCRASIVRSARWGWIRAVCGRLPRWKNTSRFWTAPTAPRGKT